MLRVADFTRDEKGLETVEYAILAGLVVVAVVAIVAALSSWSFEHLKRLGRMLHGALDPSQT